MEYCFNCGRVGTPEQAIGVDEDGEPACGLHAVKGSYATPKKEAPMETCKCGCGEQPSAGREYVWGHKNKKLPKAPKIQHDEPEVQQELSKAVQFTHAQLDRILTSLPINEKARLLSAAFFEEA